MIPIEQDRSRMRAATLKIIRVITEWPSLKIPDARRDWLRPPPLSTFRGMEPLGFGLTDEDNWWVFHPDDCPPDLVWPLDVSWTVEHSGEDGALALTRVRSVRAKDVRGIVHRISPFMARFDHGQVDRGHLLTCAGIWTYIGGHWMDADKRTFWEGNSIPSKGAVIPVSDGNSMRLASAIALKHRYEWAVSLGMENSPSIRFATDPTGIKEVFRVRDLPEGRDRREALLTWVGDHWRQKRHDPDIEVYVRKHMRGAMAFDWRGLQGEILPAPYDLEKRDQLIEQRHAMRAAGTDRRLRKQG